MSRYRIAAALFVGSFSALWGIALLNRVDPHHISYAAHFVEQARAWLHGRVDVPAWIGHDLIVLHGRTLIVYPPFPALLMLPFVVVLGERFSDIPLTWAAGAANVALLFLVLEAGRDRGWWARRAREHVVIALTFGFGTIALWLAIGGAAWFTAQTLAISGLLVMLLGTVTERWWLAATGLGAAFLTRSPDLLAGIFPLTMAIRTTLLNARPMLTTSWHGKRATLGRFFWKFAPTSDRPVRAESRSRWRHMVLSAGIPLGITLAIWMVRNALTFGDPLSSGYDIQVRQNYPAVTHGLLSWHYLWPNFVVAFLNFPTFTFQSPFDLAPSFDLLRDGDGTSVFFTTPLFLLFFLPQHNRPGRWRRGALWATVVVLVGFALLWNGTGWYQVGARYLFDAYPFAFLLLAARPEAIGPRWLAVAGVGVAINLALARAFWCATACPGTIGSGRWLATAGMFALIPLLVGLAWWWLRQSRPRGQHTPVPPANGASTVK